MSRLVLFVVCMYASSCFAFDVPVSIMDFHISQLGSAPEGAYRGRLHLYANDTELELSASILRTIEIPDANSPSNVRPRVVLGGKILIQSLPASHSLSELGGPFQRCDEPCRWEIKSGSFVTSEGLVTLPFAESEEGGSPIGMFKGIVSSNNFEGDFIGPTGVAGTFKLEKTNAMSDSH